MPLALGQNFFLENRGASIRIYRKLNQLDKDMIQFDFTNQANPDESIFQFTQEREEADHISTGIFSSEFSDYKMIVTIYEDDNSARIELTTSTTPLALYHVPVAIATKIIEYGEAPLSYEPDASQLYGRPVQNMGNNMGNNANNNTRSVVSNNSNNNSADPSYLNGGRRRKRRQTKRRQTKRRRTIKRKN
jgi:hypothetical protein